MIDVINNDSAAYHTIILKRLVYGRGKSTTQTPIFELGDTYTEGERRKRMIAQKTIQQLQHAPLAERIHVIEVLLESLKHDIVHHQPRQMQQRPFRVRTFDLGSDISLDREEMYAERGY